MPSFNSFSSCSLSSKKTNALDAVDTHAPTGTSRFAAATPEQASIPSARSEQSTPALISPPNPSTRDPLGDLQTGFPNADVAEMESAYELLLGRAQTSQSQPSVKHTLATLTTVCEHFKQHENRIAYKKFVANTLFEIAQDRFTISGLMAFLNENQNNSSINTDRMMRALGDFLSREQQRAHNSTATRCWHLQQSLEQQASAENTADPVSQWLDTDSNPQKTYEAATKLTPKKLGLKLSNRLATEIAIALKDHSRLEKVLKTGFDPKVLPEQQCNQALKLIHRLPHATRLKLFMRTPDNNLTATVVGEILKSFIPLSSAETSAQSSRINLPVSAFNNYQTGELKKHIKDMSLYRLEEFFQSDLADDLSILFATEYYSRPEGVSRLTEWLEQSSFDRMPPWANTLFVALPKAMKCHPGILSIKNVDQVTQAFQCSLAKSSTAAVLNWAQDSLPKFQFASRMHHDFARCSTEERTAMLKASTKVCQAIYARLESSPDVWQAALFDFSKFTQDPSKHLLTEIPHTYAIAAFNSLSATEKRNVFAKLLAVQHFSEEHLPRSTIVLLFKLAQDETISNTPFTAEMLQTFQAFSKALAQTATNTNWAFNPNQISETLKAVRLPADLTALMLGELESTFTTQMRTPPTKSDSVLRLERDNPCDAFLAEVSNKPNVIPRVAFHNEDSVIDIGGPLDEALMLTLDKFFADESLWIESDNGFLAPKPPQSSEDEKRWQQFGSLMGLACFRSGSLGPRLNQSFFERLLIGLQFHINATPNSDSDFRTAHNNLREIAIDVGVAERSDKALLLQLTQESDCDDHQRSLFHWLCEPNQATRASLAKSIQCEDPSVLSSDVKMHEYLTDVLGMTTDIREAIKGTLGSMLFIAKGLATYNPELAARSILAGPKILQTVINGADLTPREALLMGINASHREVLSQNVTNSEADAAHRLLRNFVEDKRLSDETLQKLLVFITAKQTVGYKSKIHAVPSNFPIIRSHTCFQALDIPRKFLRAAADNPQLEAEFYNQVTEVLEVHDGRFDMNEHMTREELIQMRLAQLAQEFGQR